MKIGLCVPAYDGRVHDSHSVSVVRTMMKARERGIDIHMIGGRGSPVLPDVRNWCVAQALAAGCDKVWFVDSDISWETCIDEALNMISAPVDIVAGVHQKRNVTWHDPAKLVVGWKKIPPKEDQETGLWEVSRVATAFVCIDRRVFEKMAEAGIAQNYLPNGTIDEDVHYPFYRTYFWYGFNECVPLDPVRKRLEELGVPAPYRIFVGEDYWFCQQAEALGFKIYIDPRIRLTHFDGCIQHNASIQDVVFEQTAG